MSRRALPFNHKNLSGPPKNHEPPFQAAMKLTQDVYCRKIQPLLAGMSTSAIAAKMGVIPLNTTAHAAVLELRDRAKLFNGTAAYHYVFPSCEHGHIDPSRPQKSWRSAWRQMTGAIECPACGRIQAPAKVCRNKTCKADIHELESPSASLRFHDLRHHAITELAESQASEQTILAIAGHVSPRMLAHYSHVRLQAKREALDALSRPILGQARKGTPKPRIQDRGYGTS